MTWLTWRQALHWRCSMTHLTTPTCDKNGDLKQETLLWLRFCVHHNSWQWIFRWMQCGLRNQNGIAASLQKMSVLFHLSPPYPLGRDKSIGWPSMTRSLTLDMHVHLPLTPISKIRSKTWVYLPQSFVTHHLEKDSLTIAGNFRISSRRSGTITKDGTTLVPP